MGYQSASTQKAYYNQIQVLHLKLQET